MFKERLEIAQAEMLEGGGFAKPLARTQLFPGAARQMFKVGEETGTLETQLGVASIYFDRELEARIKKFTTMFEPLMIVFLAVIVGTIVIALFLPMVAICPLSKYKNGLGSFPAMSRRMFRPIARPS